MIFEDAIVAWRDIAPWQNDAQVEQDLILSGMIHEIYSHPFLKDQIIFRGGTCLNKLFWDNPTRYSEDLDFVQIKSGPIGPIVDALNAVSKTIFDKDPVKKGITTRSLKLFYEFAPEMAPGKPLRIKIEVNLREHFAVEGIKEMDFRLDSPWKSGVSKVRTFSLNELLATKIRALHQRKNGRDLYDLWKAKELTPDWKISSKIFLHYMDKDKTPIHRDALINNLQAKLNDPIFKNDMTGLVRNLKDYDLRQAADFVISEIFRHIPESKTKQKKKRYFSNPVSKK
jgi:predicted nucleotidyltransferase component of viral defense system